MIYEQFFNLKQRPFSIAPNPDFLYEQGQYQEALAALQYGLHHRGGFVLLTGEVGTGKTTLCRQLLSNVPQDTEVALVLHPQLDRIEFLQAICREFDIEDLTQETEVKLIHHIHQYLLDVFSQGKNAVLVIDEAQHLDLSVLELVRLLTNLETKEEKLLQIILIGQPELKERLSRYELRQLNQRITVRYHLSPLSPSEVRAYIDHRLRVASNAASDKNQSGIFTIGSILMLHRLTAGIPRLINVVADRALMAAYAEGKSGVHANLLYKAAKEVLPDERFKFPKFPVFKMLSFSAVLFFAVMFAQTFYLADLQSNPKADSAATEALKDTVSSISNLFADRSLGYEDLAKAWNVESNAACKMPFDCWQGEVPVSLIASLAVPALVLDDGRWVRFEEANLPVTGKTTIKLIWQPPFELDRGLKIGDRSQKVAWVKNRLDVLFAQDVGQEWEVIQPSGINHSLSNDHYDFLLEQQVKQFQQQFGLKVDGVVGSQTLLTLWLLEQAEKNAPVSGSRIAGDW